MLVSPSTGTQDANQFDRPGPFPVGSGYGSGQAKIPLPVG